MSLLSKTTTISLGECADSVQEEVATKKSRNEYDYSLPLDIHRFSDFPGARDAITELQREVEEFYRSKGGRIKEKHQLRSHLMHITLDLYVAAHQPPWIYRGFSRNKNSYKAGSRYHQLFFSYRLAVRAVDALIALGYVKQKNGIHGSGYRRQSRIWATEKLIQFFKARSVKAEQIQRLPPQDVLVLKDSKGSVIDFPETSETLRIEQNVRRINAAYADIDIDLFLSDQDFERLHEILKRDPENGPLDLSRKYLRRIYNNGVFEEGGRFYGAWWQTIPKEFRQYIQIGHAGTVEIDYEATHIYILYAKAGLNCPDRPYELVDGFSREEQKQALLVLLNAKTDEAAIAVLRWKGIKFARTLIEGLKKAHSPIAEYLGTGAGLWLMKIDSDIAEQVLLTLLDSGIVCLPVHDSFIVQYRWVEQARAAMENAFKSVLEGVEKVSMKTKEEGRKIEISREAMSRLLAEYSMEQGQKKEQQKSKSWTEDYSQYFRGLSNSKTMEA